MRAYLIGPMSGIPRFNYPAFIEAVDALTRMGFEVASPTSLDSREAFDASMASPDGDNAAVQVATGFSYEDFIAKSIARILTFKPDMLVGLPGWEQSSGATKEALVAGAMGIPTHGLQVILDRAPLTEMYDPEGRWINHADNPQRQRSVTGGVKDNRDKPPVDLLPTKPLLGAADVMAFGAIKYKPHNWRLGLSWSQTWSSLQRHLLAFNDGEDIDPETGKPHIDHAVCQALFLSEYYHTKTGTDDRFTSVDKEAAKA